MTPRQVEKLLLADGWYIDSARGSHRYYKHESKVGKVTIPFHPRPKDLPKGTLNSILRQAELK